MGAAESVVRNVDKRTARREHRDAFIGSVREFRRGFDPRPAEGDPQGDAARPIRVCVRKRPMFEWEWKKEREFDVITGGADRVVIHDARMEADMRRMYMDHHEFGGPSAGCFLTLRRLPLSLEYAPPAFGSRSICKSDP